MISALILAGIGWLGLLLVMTATLPTVGPRWLFFFLWTLALTGTSLPFIWLLNRRFSSHRLPQTILLREALLVGLYGGLCAWLQINRSLTLPLALLLATGLIAIEWLLRSFDQTAGRLSR
ncbi:MAG: hypothetical protein ACLFWD_00020 [Anaerolineales bacterium]